MMTRETASRRWTRLGLILGLLALAPAIRAQDFSGLEIFGSNKADSVAGVVFDAEGNAYFVGQSVGMTNKYAGSLWFGRLNADGSIAWVKDFGTSANGETSVRPVGDSAKGNGASRSIAMGDDGDIYLVARSNHWAKNAFYASVVMRLDHDGNLVWGHLFKNEWIKGTDLARSGTEGLALALGEKHVYVVGTTRGEQDALVYALDRNTGALTGHLAYDPAPGSNDRALTAVVDRASNKLWVGGWSGKAGHNRPTLSCVDLSGGGLKLDWVGFLSGNDLPAGTVVSDIDVDAQGQVYMTFWIGGATKWFELVKLSPDGQILWGRRYNSTGNPKNESMLCRVFGDRVVLAGRLAIAHPTWSDNNGGESAFLVYDLDGNLRRDFYYFTGTHKLKTTIDSIKGLGLVGDKLMAGGTIYSEGANFAGQWLTPKNIPEALTPVSPSIQSFEGSVYVFERETGVAVSKLASPEARPFQHDSIDKQLQIRETKSGLTVHPAANRPQNSEDAFRFSIKGLLD